MEMYFSKENKEVYVSHTKVELPTHKGKALTLVMVYGLSEEKPMMLFTNRMVSCKEDVHKIVRAYMTRWRIEENFRFKKQQYRQENMRVRTLHAMNVMNTLLMIIAGHIGMLAESVDKKAAGYKNNRKKQINKRQSIFMVLSDSKGDKEYITLCP